MSSGFAALSAIYPFFEIIGGCDINADATKTFERNFGAPGINQDIRSLVEDDGEFEHFTHKLKRRDPEKPLVVIGCAPCQGFTSHRKKNWHKDDERNTLIGAFASVAVRLNPEAIVMENVPEILSGKYWSHYEEARRIFEKAGYVVHQAIYNAAAFGVPQERFRAVVVALKKDFVMFSPMLTPEKFKTVKDAIGSLPAVHPGKPHSDDGMHRSAAHREATLQTIRAIPKDGGSRPPGVGPQCLDKVKGFYDVYGRLSWNKPAITITHYARNPASGRFVHPEQNRGLTAREAALLQSFPRGFEFIGSFDSIFKQIGEAVPPKFACAVASGIVAELLSPPPTKSDKARAHGTIIDPVSNSFSSVIAGLKTNRST